MPLVVRISKLSKRLTALVLIGSAVVGAVALSACVDDTTAPVRPPGDTLPDVDPNDPAFQRSVHFVAPGGAWANTGDATAPWDLNTALVGAGGRVTPGDTIWIRGGTYRGAFDSRVAGDAGRPVLLRAWPDERAVIEHAGDDRTTLIVHGDWTTFWGVEVMNADPDRSTLSTASEVRPNGIVNHASHTRYINLVVHDAGVGFYSYPNSVDVELYGSIFFNNGWQGPDRGHGHAIYVKSDAGPLAIRDNVMFNQFGWGVHAFSESGSGQLNNIQVERNAAFNNGALASSPGGENILLGGDERSTGSNVRNNVTWFPPGTASTNVRIGYGSVLNGTVGVIENTFVGGDPVLRVGSWGTASFVRNTLAGSGGMVQLEDASLGGYVWNDTKQQRDPLSASWTVGAVEAPFLLWTTLTGLGLSDIVGSAPPPTPTVQVWPNAYEPGRAYVVVINWTRDASVRIPLDDVLAAGESFEIRNVQDLWGAPVMTGAYGGPVSVPMTGASPPVPIGLTSSRAPHTGPDFDVFVVIRR